MLKIGVISDTHLKKVTQRLEEIYRKYLRDMDMILHAGDFVSVEVAEFLNQGNFHGVHGNMDPPDVISLLPEKKVIEAGSQRIGLIHGCGPAEGIEDRIWNKFSDVDVIVYGHSHSPANHTKEGVLLFNPGTAIGYDMSGPHSIGILQIDKIVRGKIVHI
jgi:putative phosphoesterase